MKAAFINQTGPPENIQVGDLPKPVAKKNELLIRVAAVSVNPIDTYVRNGANFWELPTPFIVGSDFAGTVEEIGPDATRFKPGDRVWGSNQGLLGRQGTFAEYCCVDEEFAYPTPHDVADETAAACALVGITAHLGLFNRAQLRAGESIFVNGGTGGVGSMVVQMAKAAGARVMATCGSPEKCELAKKLGADVSVNYKTDDIAAAVEAFSPDGMNVIWETTREPDFERLVGYLAERGRLIVMAGRDAKPAFPVGPFYVKGCSLLGFVMFKASSEDQRNCATDMNRWLSEKKIEPRISHRFQLEAAAEAHRLQEQNTLEKAGTLQGKIVLTV